MKIGQKVVFNGLCVDKEMNLPEPFKEILTIDSVSEFFNDSYYISGYLFAKDGYKQRFNVRSLIPLDDWQQAEYMVSELIEETLIPVEA